MRRFCAVLTILLAAAAAFASSASAQIPRGKVLEFEAFRNGSSIGTHRLSFWTEGSAVKVDVSIRLKVALAFVTLYRYEHDSQESWEGGRLVGLATRTNDDGKATEVRAKAEGDELKIEGSGGQFSLPLGTFPTSYWKREITAQSLVLDTQDGVRTKVEGAAPVRETYPVLGKAVPADRYSLSGELPLDLWYTPKGEWIGLRFTSKGSEITYARRTPLDD
ncbi:MAG: DUF6134 family protein [Elsteraceae bacterium]